MNAAKYVLRMAFKYAGDEKMWKEHFDDMTTNEIIDICLVDLRKDAEAKALAQMKEKVKSLMFKIDLLEDES